MYLNLGIREQECTREEYQGGRTILHIRTKKKHLYCPIYGSKRLLRFNLEVQHRCAKIARIFVLGKKSSEVFSDGGLVQPVHEG